MATSTIGSGGDYATIADWITFLQSDHGSGAGVLTESQTGEILDHQTPSASVTFSGITTSLSNYVELTSSASNRHNGISNESGGNDHARITIPGGILLEDINYFRFNWLELIGNNPVKSSGSILITSISGSGELFVHNNILHANNSSSHGDNVCLKINSGNLDARLYRNIIYGYEKGIQASGNVTTRVYNNTVLSCTQGIVISGSSAISRNNVAIGNTTDFVLTAGNNDYNASEDGTAVGSNSYSGINPDEYFVNPTATFTSTDMHRKTYSGFAIDLLTDSGQDLGSTYATDIDGEGILVGWELGADEGLTTADFISIPVSSPLEIEIDLKRWSSAQLPLDITLSGHIESITDVNMPSVYVDLNGTGLSVNDDFTAVTDSSGNFEVDLPNGWTGTVTASLLVDHPHMAVDTSYTYSDPLLSDVTGVDFIFTYTPPIGIVTPTFGIYQQSPPPPSSWDSVTPPYYYIDNTHSSATDSGESDAEGNYYGYPNVPRLTFPSTIPAGAIIYVAGGPYEPVNADNLFDFIPLGTAVEPIYISSYFPNSPVKITLDDDEDNAVVRFTQNAAYCIFENFNLENATITHFDKFVDGDLWVAPHHIVIRHCEIHDTAITSGANGIVVSNRGTSSLLRAHDLVWYNNYIHDLGDILGTVEFDQDAHATSPGNAYRVWILDNEMTLVSGDGMQVGNTGGNSPGSGELDDVLWYSEDIYYGYNYSHDNRQSGGWVKVARYVIFSQNTVHGARPVWSDDFCPGSPGVAMGMQYHQDKIFYIYNRISDADNGIIIGDTAARGVVGGRDIYFIGNIISDINHSVGDTADGGNIICGGGKVWNPWSANDSDNSGAAIRVRRGWTVHIINNTIIDCEGGIFVASLEATPKQRSVIVNNNIIYNSDTMRSLSFNCTADTAAVSDVKNNLLYNPSGDARVRWHSTGDTYTVSDFRVNFPIKSLGILEDNPDFADIDTENYRLTSASPCVDSGLDVLSYYNDFEEIFNNDQSIQKDFDGHVRPVDSWDMGAFEFDGEVTSVDLALLSSFYVVHDGIEINDSINMNRINADWRVLEPAIGGSTLVELDAVNSEFKTQDLANAIIYTGPEQPVANKLRISQRHGDIRSVPFRPYAVILKYKGRYEDIGGFGHTQTQWNIRSKAVTPYINLKIITTANGPLRQYNNVYDGQLRKLVIDLPLNQTKIKVRIRFKSSDDKWSDWSDYENFITRSKDYKRPGGNPAQG